MEEYERIELRSEKVRNIIGRVPPALLRFGITFITFLLVALLLAGCFIPYPESLKMQAEITSKDRAALCIPYSYIAQIKKDMPVQIELEGYNAHTYGYLKAHITTINPKVIVRNDKNFFAVTVRLLPTSDNAPFIEEKMKGNAFILLSDKSIMAHLISK